MAYEALTDLDLEVVRGPRVNKKNEHAYVDKVPGLLEALENSGLYKENYEEILFRAGIDAEKISPKRSTASGIDEHDGDQVLALLTAIVEKDKYVEGFSALCLERGLIGELLDSLEELDYINREIPAWIEEAVGDILEQLSNSPADHEMTSNSLIQPYLHFVDDDGTCKKRPFEWQEELDVKDMLQKRAADYGLYLDSSMYEYMVIGTPGNIPFRVRWVEIGASGPKVIFQFGRFAWIGGSRSIQIDEYANGYECKIEMMPDLEENRVFEVDEAHIDELRRACERIGVRRWSVEYVNSNTLDGEHWSLHIEDAEGIFDSSGSNAYPANFDELLQALHDLFCFDVR